MKNKCQPNEKGSGLRSQRHFLRARSCKFHLENFFNARVRVCVKFFYRVLLEVLRLLCLLEIVVVVFGCSGGARIVACKRNA